MFKRLFLPQRYLQRRNEIIIPPGAKKKSRRQWVLSRGLCYYHLFDLTDMPIARRESVLQLKIRQWSPFQNFASYNVWQNGLVQVWIWNKQELLEVFAETGIKKATVVPESVLRQPSTLDEVQLLQCLDGFEGQIWKNGVLVGSHWWANMPELNDWINFQRAHSLPVTQTLFDAIDVPLLARPWGKNRKRIHRFYLFYQEPLWVMLGAAIFVALFSWQAVRVWKWQQALIPVQVQIDELRESIAPILSKRTLAIADKSQADKLLALNPFPSQLELMQQVAKLIPRQQVKLVQWFYQMGKLRFTLEAQKTHKLEPTFYVKTFQKQPGFKEVKIKTGSGRYANQITISLLIGNGE